jgi:hypothetical protein
MKTGGQQRRIRLPFHPVAAGAALVPTGGVAVGAAPDLRPAADPPLRLATGEVTSGPTLAALPGGLVEVAVMPTPAPTVTSAAEHMQHARGSAGLFLPMPPPEALPVPGGAPSPTASPDPLPRAAPVIDDAGTVASAAIGTFEVAVVPAAVEPAGDATRTDAQPDPAPRDAQQEPGKGVGPDPATGGTPLALNGAAPAAAAQDAPAFLVVHLVPRLKNDAMLGPLAAPLPPLALPLAELAASAARQAGVALSGTAGPDSLWGGAGNDLLTGGAGDDLLFAGAGANTLMGGVGDDILVVTSGQNVLIGGPGRDLFVVGLPDLLRRGDARILDFEAGVDALVVPHVPGSSAYDGWGDLVWGSPLMTVTFSTATWDAYASVELGRPMVDYVTAALAYFTAVLHYPPHRYWNLSVETPRLRDILYTVSDGAQVIADPRDPAHVVVIEPPAQEPGPQVEDEVIDPPAEDEGPQVEDDAPPFLPPATPLASELDLI